MKKLSKRELFQLTLDMLKGESTATENQIAEMIQTYEQCLEILNKRGE